MWSEKMFPNPSFSPLSGFRLLRFSGASATLICIPSPFPLSPGSVPFGARGKPMRAKNSYTANVPIRKDAPQQGNPLSVRRGGV
jgi:hypothetical protein